MLAIVEHVGSEESVSENNSECSWEYTIVDGGMVNDRGKWWLTQSLIRIGRGRINGVLDWRLVLLHWDRRLSGTADIVIVLGVASRDAAGDGVVGLLVLIIGRRHDCRWVD